MCKKNVVIDRMTDIVISVAAAIIIVSKEKVAVCPYYYFIVWGKD